jgi:hypothetical protein
MLLRRRGQLGGFLTQASAPRSGDEGASKRAANSEARANECACSESPRTQVGERAVAAGYVVEREEVGEGEEGAISIVPLLLASPLTVR